MRFPERGNIWKRLLAVLFWLVLWETAARAVGHAFLLASPFSVLQSLGSLLTQADARLAVLRSSLRILSGFFTGSALGICAAALSARYCAAKYLLSPLVGVTRSVPVASFAILAIILAGSRGLSSLVTLVVAFPVVYGAAAESLACRNKSLSEMARVFRVPKSRAALFVTLPQALPYLRSGLTAALGMCFKSGVAAELIGIPAGTVGEALYVVKVSLQTPELFAWTILIILVSSLCAALLRLALRGAENGLARL